MRCGRRRVAALAGSRADLELGVDLEGGSR